MTRFAPFAAAGLLALSACGPAPSPHTPTPAPTVSPSPTPTQPTDTDRIDVVASGIGTWQLVSVPVAIIRSAAHASTASGVLVHLTPMRAGRPLTPLVTPALTLGPGETLVVAANCTDTCVGADATAVSVTAGTWSAQAAPTVSATAAAPTCTVSCRGHGQWDVPLTAAGPGLVSGEQVDLFASCTDTGGAIVGGGQRTLVWPQQGGSLTLDVPVIVSTAPAACSVGATTSN